MQQGQQAHDTQIFTILLCGWLGGYNSKESGRLLTIEEVGEIMKGTVAVPKYTPQAVR